MAETITNPDEHTAVEEMYNQAVNNNALSDAGERETLEQFAQEVGTTIDALAAARKNREQEAAQRLSDKAVQHYLDTDANAEHWVKPKE